MVAAVAAETRPGALDDLRVAKGRNHIAEAWLADATTRYRHFVLGAPYEAASIVAKLQDGRTVKLTLPEDSVFEDRQPRLADLDGDGRDEIVLVRSYLGRGAALAIVALVDVFTLSPCMSEEPAGSTSQSRCHVRRRIASTALAMTGQSDAGSALAAP